MKWKDIDFEDRSILVRRNYVRNRIEDSPKNGKVRRVNMSERLVASLRPLKKKTSETLLSNGEGNIDDKWLFSVVKILHFR